MKLFSGLSAFILTAASASIYGSCLSNELSTNIPIAAWQNDPTLPVNGPVYSGQYRCAGVTGSVLIGQAQCVEQPIYKCWAVNPHCTVNLKIDDTVYVTGNESGITCQVVSGKPGKKK